jgi:proteasome lid subunit RPN8/RPN11
MQITRRAANKILKTVGSKTAERGGILLGPRGTDLVTDFLFDSDNTNGKHRYEYEPNVNFLNGKLRKTSCEIKGVLHSHPKGYRSPSQEDLDYAAKTFAMNPSLDELWLPIIVGPPIKEFEDEKNIFVWLVCPKGQYYSRKFLVIDEKFPSCGV